MDYMEARNEAQRLFVEISDKFHVIPRSSSAPVSELVEMLTKWFVYVAVKSEQRALKDR